MQKTRASRGAKAGLEMSAVAADTFEIQHLAPEIQKNRLRHRFGLAPATAAVVAGLAYGGTVENWRGRQ